MCDANAIRHIEKKFHKAEIIADKMAKDILAKIYILEKRVKILEDIVRDINNQEGIRSKSYRQIK